MSRIIQRNFSAGEIAPELYGRADQIKYQTGLRLAKNIFVTRSSAISNRAGFQFIGETKDSSKTSRLINFIFNDTQTYIIEVGDLYMRFFRNASRIRVSGVAGWSSTTTYEIADLVQFNGIHYYSRVDGNIGNQPDVSPDEWHAMEDDIYEIPSPYPEADIDDIQFVQSGDTITLVHTSHPPRFLQRFADTEWKITDIDFLPNTGRPGNISATGGPAGTQPRFYKVAAISDETHREGPVGIKTGESITGASQTDPVTITITGHSMTIDDTVFIKDVEGMEELNGREYEIENLTANTFDLTGIDGTNFAAYDTGGTAHKTQDGVLSGAPTRADPITFVWDPVRDARQYAVYRSDSGKGGPYGFLGTTVTTSFEDNSSIDPDYSDTPIVPRNPFTGTDNFPGTTAFVAQRQIFANTNNNPQKFWMSQPADFKSFAFRSPPRSDDSINQRLVSGTVPRIQHLVESNGILILTSDSEWRMSPDQNGEYIQGNLSVQVQSYNGSSALRPIVVDSFAIYVQDRGKKIRDLVFSFEVDGYQGNDLSRFSHHLLDDFEVLSWDYSRLPHSLVWMVRDDGRMLGMTYLPNERIIGWHQHTTDGTFESVSVVPEGGEDIPYVIVKRTVNGATKRYVERMSERRWPNGIEDAYFVDSGLTFDGRNTDTSHTMEITGGTDWDVEETLTVLSSKSFFMSGDVGNQVVFTSSDGTIVRITIDTFNSSSEVQGKPNRTVPGDLRNSPTTNWSRAVDVLAGLDHLEGKTVSIFGDGNVLPQETVSLGQITVDEHVSVAHVGLPYTSDVETLDIEPPEGTFISRKKRINKISLVVERSRGIFAGPDENNLKEWKQRDTEGYDDPLEAENAIAEIQIGGGWTDGGRLFIRQQDPVPLTVLALQANIMVGD